MECRPLHPHPPQNFLSYSRQVLAMASSSLSVVLLLCLAAAVSAQLSSTYYEKSCPSALPTINKLVTDAVAKDPRMGASLLRLHFHDCFVQGCDASVLLASPDGNEQSAGGNAGSLRGLDLIQNIKNAVEAACKSNKRTPLVSCADILAVAARDSVVALGGPSWTVQLGRRDSIKAASVIQTNADLPPPSSSVAQLIVLFDTKGFNVTEMVALSGAHTIGRAQCKNFRNRLYNEANIDSTYATKLQAKCPQFSGDTILANLDDTETNPLNPDLFDNGYFVSLKLKKGLLHSDQELFTGTGGTTDSIVDNFATDPDAFRNAFASAMENMGSLSPLTGSDGMVRRTCSTTKL